jgi:hypothetical protein
MRGYPGKHAFSWASHPAMEASSGEHPGVGCHPFELRTTGVLGIFKGFSSLDRS